MPSSGMWLRVGLIYIDVSEERVASIFRAERITRARTLSAINSPTFILSRYSVYSEDGNEAILRNVGFYKAHTATHLRRRHSP
jgi:hypothetical protein